MKNSTELIDYFNKREKELGEKATKFNMFLEGCALLCFDTKEDVLEEVSKWLKENNALKWDDGVLMPLEPIFRKYFGN